MGVHIFLNFILGIPEMCIQREMMFASIGKCIG